MVSIQPVESRKRDIDSTTENAFVDAPSAQNAGQVRSVDISLAQNQAEVNASGTKATKRSEEDTPSGASRLSQEELEANAENTNTTEANSSSNDYQDIPFPTDPKVWAVAIGTGHNDDIVYINKSPFVFGRARSCDHNLAHMGISSRHCVIERVDNREFKITDTSTNGIFFRRVRKLGKGNSEMCLSGSEISLLRAPDSMLKYTFHLRHAGLRIGGGAKSESVAGTSGGPLVMSHFERYMPRASIGAGGYAEVRYCVDSLNGNRLAMKILEARKFAMTMGSDVNESRNLLRETVMREVAILKRLDHPNIIKMHDFFATADGSQFVIVLDVARHGDLLDFLVDSGHTLKEEDCRELFRQIVEATKYVSPCFGPNSLVCYVFFFLYPLILIY